MTQFGMNNVKLLFSKSNQVYVRNVGDKVQNRFKVEDFCKGHPIKPDFKKH